MKGELKVKALALDLPVDPLQMRAPPIISHTPSAGSRNSFTRTCRVVHTQTHTSVGSKTEREAFFSVRNGEKGRKKERQKGDYNLIRGRKSWSNPPEGAEMPPCWRLLDYPLTGLHLNGLLWHRQQGRQPKKQTLDQEERNPTIQRFGAIFLHKILNQQFVNPQYQLRDFCWIHADEFCGLACKSMNLNAQGLIHILYISFSSLYF